MTRKKFFVLLLVFFCLLPAFTFAWKCIQTGTLAKCSSFTGNFNETDCMGELCTYRADFRCMNSTCSSFDDASAKCQPAQDPCWAYDGDPNYCMVHYAEGCNSFMKQFCYPPPSQPDPVPCNYATLTPSYCQLKTGCSLACDDGTIVGQCSSSSANCVLKNNTPSLEACPNLTYCDTSTKTCKSTFLVCSNSTYSVGKCCDQDLKQWFVPGISYECIGSAPYAYAVKVTRVLESDGFCSVDKSNSQPCSNGCTMGSCNPATATGACSPACGLGECCCSQQLANEKNCKIGCYASNETFCCGTSGAQVCKFTFSSCGLSSSPCYAGFGCNPETGACRENRCEGANCGSGNCCDQTSGLLSCIPKNCPTIAAGQSYQYNDSKCGEIDCSEKCPAGTTPSNGICACNEGEIVEGSFNCLVDTLFWKELALQNGKCVPVSKHKDCEEEGSECVETSDGASCVQPNCTPKKCSQMGWSCGSGVEPNCDAEIFCGNCSSGTCNLQTHKCEAGAVVSPTSPTPSSTPFSTPSQTPTAEATCSDGTLPGSCSVSQPYYCESGSLVEKPVVCGCPSGTKLDYWQNSCVIGSLGPAPVISNEKVSVASITSGSASVEWSTDQPAIGRVVYWEEGKPETKYYAYSDDSFKGWQVVELEGLKPSTCYLFYIEAWNEQGVSAIKQGIGFKCCTLPSVEPQKTAKDGNVPAGFGDVLVVPAEALSAGIPEGSIMEFGVEMAGEDSGKFYFQWDFGDGASGEGMKAVHYYGEIPIGLQFKEYLVSVMVFEGGVLRSKRYRLVRVLKARLKARLLKPALYELVSKEAGQALELEFLDAENKRFDAGKIFLLEVGIKGAFIDLNAGKDNIFRGSLDANVFFNQFEVLEIRAEAKQDKNTFKAFNRIPLFFRPAEISIEDPFSGKNYFLNSTLGLVELNAFYSGGKPVEEAEFGLEVLGSAKREKYLAGKGKGVFVFDVNFKVGKEDIKNGVMANFDGSDAYGNKAKVSGLGVPVSRKNPLFNLEILAPDMNAVLGHGEAAEFTVAVNSSRYAGLKKVRVRLVNLLSGESILMVSVGKGLYSAETAMPAWAAGKDSTAFFVEGEAELDGNALFGFDEIGIMLSKAVFIDFNYPDENGSVFERPGGQAIKVRLSYPDGKILDRPDVSARVFLNGTEERVALHRDNESGLYFAGLGKAAIFGNSENHILFVLEEPLYGSKSFGSFVEDSWLSLMLAAGFAALCVLLLLLFFARRKFLSKSMEKQKEKDKIACAEGLLKKYEFEYLKRHISEEEFRKKRLVLLEELKELKGKKPQGK